MKDLIKDRLQKIDHLEDRRLLKHILNGVFQNLVDYSQQQLEELEQRVFSEIEVSVTNLTIYSTLIKLEDYDPINDFFYPVDPRDLKQAGMNPAAIEKTIRQDNQRPVLGKIYLAMDYLRLQQLYETLPERRFSGTLVTNLRTYPIELKLSPYCCYLDQIKMLYELFLKNNLIWRTILHPYLYKYLQIKLMTELTFAKEEQVMELNINFEELEPYKKVDRIPLWNIQYLQVTSAGFAKAAKDRIYYEHEVDLDDQGETAHGYLIDTHQEEIHYTYRKKGKIIVVSPKERVNHWDIYQIKQLSKDMEQGLKEKVILSNERAPYFTDQFARGQDRIIRTKGDIARLTHLYPSTKELTLADVKICERGTENKETYHLNLFLKDLIRKEEDKKFLQLSFTAAKQDVLIRDKMSFLVAEIQQRLPEFICVGELL